VKQVQNAQDLRINGLAAHTANAVVATDDGERLARFTVIYLNNQAYVMAGITRDPAAISRFDGTFLGAARTFRPLTAAERKLAGQVQRLNLVRADNKTTFAGLAAATPLQSLKEEHVRLVNGRYPRGEVMPGEWLKTIQ